MSLSKEKIWFIIKNISKYYIYNGNRIMVEPYKNTNDHHVKSFLLGSAFGMLLYQKNIIAIHGGTILIDNQAVIITGNQGAGKSTLISALSQKGYPFMSDDISVIRKCKDKSLMVFPAYPQQKLCRDSMFKMGYKTDMYKKIDEGRDKYAIPVHNSFQKEPMFLGAIFEITTEDCSCVDIEEITGTKKLELILKNIYRIRVIQYAGIRPEYFRECLNIAKNIPVFKIRRPKGKFSVEDQVRVIAKYSRKND